MGRLNPSRETTFSGANGCREKFIFPIQLTMSRIGNLTRSIHTLLYVMTINTTAKEVVISVVLALLPLCNYQNAFPLLNRTLCPKRTL